MWTSTSAIQICVLCQAAAFLTAVEGTCTPTKDVPSSIASGVTLMEYEKGAASGGYFPANANKDRDDVAVAFASSQGISISGCAGAAEYCSVDGFSPLCPETCGLTNDPVAGIGVASPPGPGPFPLFVYFPGTAICAGESGPLQLVQEMVKHGFVSASIEYPALHLYDDFDEKAAALVNGTASPLGMLCGMPHVDCSLGIASAGYSQGSHLAVLIAKYAHALPGAPNVTAALVVAGGKPTVFSIPPSSSDEVDDARVAMYLPKERRRSVVIDGDEDFAPTTEAGLHNQKATSGYDCGDSFDCLQEDGSGYFIIDNQDLEPLPDWYAAFGLGWHVAIYDLDTMHFQPWFLEGPEAWTMKNSLAWLASTATGAPWSGSGPGPTCGEVKAAYKESHCCGNPNGLFRMDRADRRLSSPADAGDSLLLAIEQSLKQALKSGGRAKARQLAQKVLGELPAGKAVV